MDEHLRKAARDGWIPWRDLEASGELAARVGRYLDAASDTRIVVGGWNLKMSMVVTNDYETRISVFLTVFDEEDGGYVSERLFPAGALFDRVQLQNEDHDPDNMHIGHFAYRHYTLGREEVSRYTVGLAMLAGVEHHPGILLGHTKDERI